MTRARLVLMALAAMACASTLAHAEDAKPSIGAERAAIRQERSAANARLATREQECLNHFVATPCLDEARRDNRETLARLRHREAELDATERKLRTDARRQEIEENQRHDSERQKEVAVPEQRESVRQAATPQVTVRPRIDVPKPERANSEADEARNRAEFEARQREIAAHREAVEARNLERNQKGKVAAPLPLPPAASAP